ncbi:MAG: branched-chain amino acid transaminase [Patescibacteria group bacterium]|jgi:branched-chain amino acid aminotransferase
METTKYIWQNGKLVNWEDAKIHVLSHSLHYGSGVFEGIRVYETKKGPAIFRLPEHVDRFFYSANAMKMKMPWTKDEFKAAIIETVKKNDLKSGYIRPLAFYGYGELRISPLKCPVEAIIAAWPWGKYLSADPIKVKVPDYIRIHPKSSIADAKICGHYVNSILSFLEVEAAGYHEALLLDFEGNIAEGPGENFFLVSGGKLATPKLGNILAGITRQSIIELAGDLGYAVEEKTITLDAAIAADECFFTGTAAEVTPIGSINDCLIAGGAFGPITRRFNDEFMKIVSGENEKYEKWLTYAN